MFYPPEVIEEIREGNDIVNIISNYVALKQKGNLFFALCPFHNESSPSFSVNPDKQLYYCFGCGASGNTISFIMAIENFDFIAAIDFLAEKINYKIPEDKTTKDMKLKAVLKQKLYEIHVVAARFFYDNLSQKDGEIANEYLDNRKLSLNIRKKFGLGFSVKNKNYLYKHLESKGFEIEDILKSGLVIESKNRKGDYFDRFSGRLMFPIFDVSGKIVGFGGRILDTGEPKYLNSPDTLIFDKSKNLYGLNFARKSKYKEIILVEGYMDTISLHQVGFANAVASLGTAFNIEHAKLLKKYAESVVILFDSDSAGTKAALRAIPIIASQGIKIKVLQLQNAKDPDEFILKFGVKKFEQAISNAKNHIAFQTELLKSKYDFSNTEQKIEFTFEVSKLLKELDSEVLVDAYANEISKMTDISVSAIKKHISEISEPSLKNVNNVYKKNFQYKNAKEPKGVTEAKKNLIYIISIDHNIYTKVKDILNPEELVSPVYVKLLNLIYEFNQKNQKIDPALMVNFFENIEEHKLVAEIFNTTIEQKDYADLQKALREQIILVKKYNFSILKLQAKENGDLKEVLKISNQEKDLNNLHITLIDG